MGFFPSGDRFLEHFAALSFSRDADVLTGGPAAGAEREAAGRRAAVAGLPAEADRLAELVDPVGITALPARERMSVLAGRLVREAVLQQSALSPTAGGIPLAAGLALADHLRGLPRVTCCFFGDGAFAEGEFHETQTVPRRLHSKHTLWAIEGLDNCGASARLVHVEGDQPGADDPETVGRTALLEDTDTGEERDFAGETEQPVTVFGRQSAEKSVSFRRHEGASPCAAPAVRSSFRAWASSVMSMPTGHHTMHRPQPTQPELPNWSYQVPSLWVAHCR